MEGDRNLIKSTLRIELVEADALLELVKGPHQMTLMMKARCGNQHPSNAMPSGSIQAVELGASSFERQRRCNRDLVNAVLLLINTSLLVTC